MNAKSLLKIIYVSLTLLQFISCTPAIEKMITKRDNTIETEANHCEATHTRIIASSDNADNDLLGFNIWLGSSEANLNVVKRIEFSSTQTGAVSNEVLLSDLGINFCTANYISVTSFDEAGNETAPGAVFCVGERCEI